MPMLAHGVSDLQIYTQMALKRLATEHRLNVRRERQTVVILQRSCNLGPCCYIQTKLLLLIVVVVVAA